MNAGAILVLLAVAMQSVGKVLYGTFLSEVSTAMFVLLSACVIAAVFLVMTRGRLPREGLGSIAASNVATATSFVCFFFALKHLPPAVVAAFEIGVSLVTALVVTSLAGRTWPPLARMVACAGIVAGCSILAIRELAGTSTGLDMTGSWLAIAATILAGIACAFATTTSRQLSLLGWSSYSVLAHRFYLAIAATGLWVLFDGQPLPQVDTAGVILVMAVMTMLLPLLFMQFALRRIDAVTFLICMALQPVLSYAFSLISPAYEGDGVVLAGVLVVSAFVAMDVVTQNRPARQARPSPSPKSFRGPRTAH